MKKTYIAPTLEIYNMTIASTILAGSVPEISMNDDWFEGDLGDAQSRELNSILWGELGIGF